MARLKAKNMAGTTLTADITAAATSFGVANASLLPDCPFRVTIYSPDPQATAYEIVEVGAKDEVANTVSSVQRGLEETTAIAHSAGAYIEAKWTAEMYEELETEAGAQAKADTAEANAKAYTDQEVGSVNADLSSHLNDYATLENSGHIKHGTYIATVRKANWTGTETPYTQTVTVTGILSTDTPIIDIVMSGTYATDETRGEAWGNIYRITTADNAITLYAKEKPSVDLPLQIKVVR